ncbi:hypothetical protein XENOCAPTIV_025998, partial [Xenoophorus captivus]
LEGKLSIVEKYRDRIPELVARLKACSESDLHRADFIVGTVHKAKGLEFDTVIVSDDFTTIPAASHKLCHFRDFSFCVFCLFSPLFKKKKAFGLIVLMSFTSAAKVPDDEWNLLYVAVTRAMTSLVVTKNVLRLLTVAGVGHNHTAHHHPYCLLTVNTN